MQDEHLEGEQRLPPHDLTAEAAVLGACLVDPRAIETTITSLNGDDFFRMAHRVVFEAIRNIAVDETDKVVDFVTVIDWLTRHRKIEVAGGPVGLVSLTEKVASASNVEAYVQVVKEKSQLRKLQSALTQAQAEVFSSSSSASTVISLAEELVLGVVDPSLGNGFAPMAGVVEEHLMEVASAMTAKSKRSVGTGYYFYDHYTGGLYPGQLVLIAARPGQGKTALALNWAANLCEADVQVAFLSLEMTRGEVMERLICSRAELSSRDVAAGRLEPGQFEHYKKCAEVVATWPFRLCDEELDLTALKSQVRSLVRRHKVRVIFVDYIQLLDVKEGENTREKVSLASKTLKRLAKSLRITIVACAQLNRASEGGLGKPREPRTSDLGESGSLERDADVIVFVYPQNNDNSTEYVAKRGKNRKGPTGRSNIRFNKDYTRFEQGSEPWRDQYGQPPA